MTLKPLSFILCLVSIFFVVPADAKILTVSVDGLNVRSGPGRTYPVLELVRKAEQFEILNEKKGWYRINVEGTIGWVSGKAVKVEEISRGVAATEDPVTRSSLQLYDRTWAVVVGINQYRNLGRRDQLDYAVSDAKAMEKMLRDELGFKHVRALYNQDANKNSILAALNTYLADTGKEDAVFVFFAGHGHSVFTGRLIEALRGKADVNEDGFITAVELELYVGDKVFEDARRRGKPQNPQFGNLFGGEGRFVFRTKRADQVITAHAASRTVFIRNEKIRTGQAETETQEIAPKKRDDVSAGVIQLRSEAGAFSSVDEIESMVKRKGFSNYNLNPAGDFPNEYDVQTVKGAKVVIDRATGLMWQQAGSSELMTWKNAHNYVKQLNRERYAGFSDWRLPTIEELASLLAPMKKNGDLYIDPVFDPRQRSCWSADKVAVNASQSAWDHFFGSKWAWFVHFGTGHVYSTNMVGDDWVRVVRSRQ
jgi:uncharacterized protein YraI